MASWQVDYEGLPGYCRAEAPGDLRKLIDEHGSLDSFPLWGGRYRCADIAVVLDEQFQKLRSWHRDVLIWSVKDDTRIELTCDNGFVSSVRVRIDVRQLTQPHVKVVLDFLDRADLCLYSHERRIVIPGDMHSLWQDLVSSRAMDFVMNPETSLRNK